MADTPRGLTTTEVASLLRIGPDRVRSMILRGELGAVDTAVNRCGRPRFIILPCHLDAWQQARSPAKPKPIRRRKRQAALRDYYPD